MDGHIAKKFNAALYNTRRNWRRLPFFDLFRWPILGRGEWSGVHGNQVRMDIARMENVKMESSAAPQKSK